MSKYRGGIGPAGAQGLSALRGASSVIKSIQRGTIAMNTTSDTATIAAVDVANTRLRFLGFNDNNAADNIPDASIRIALTNATTVTATRASSGASNPIVSYEVIEYFPGVIKSIQRGSIAILSAATATATIEPVNTAKSEIDYLGVQFPTTATQREWAYLTLTNGTTVTGTRSSAAGTTTTVGFQVVEWF